MLQLFSRNDWIQMIVIFCIVTDLISVFTVFGILTAIRERVTDRYTKPIMKKYGVWKYIRSRTWQYIVLEYLECLIPGLNIVITVDLIVRLEDLERAYDRVSSMKIINGAKQNVEKQLENTRLQMKQEAEAEV